MRNILLTSAAMAALLAAGPALAQETPIQPPNAPAAEGATDTDAGTTGSTAVDTGVAVGGTAGAVTGAIVGGPVGAVIGGFAGATLGTAAAVPEPAGDYVVANPPFSDKTWSTGLTPSDDLYQRFAWGEPPAKQGDYAYLLHIIRSMKAKGKAACILPHGVLFRGNAEATIRKELVRSGYLKGIIGRPARACGSMIACRAMIQSCIGWPSPAILARVLPSRSSSTAMSYRRSNPFRRTWASASAAMSVRWVQFERVSRTRRTSSVPSSGPPTRRSRDLPDSGQVVKGCRTKSDSIAVIRSPS